MINAYDIRRHDTDASYRVASLLLGVARDPNWTASGRTASSTMTRSILQVRIERRDRVSRPLRRSHRSAHNLRSIGIDCLAPSLSQLEGDAQRSLDFDHLGDYQRVDFA